MKALRAQGKVSGAVSFQACDAEKCLPPATRPFEALVQVSDR
jgi:hypothetical protein